VPARVAAAMVLVPTRELALQVAEVLAPVAASCIERCSPYGGASRHRQIDVVNRGVGAMWRLHCD
jgi:superfamily II DNA/RNA helicase